MIYRNHKKIFRFLFFSAILALAFNCSSFATQTTKQLAPGVVFTQDINTDPGCALIINTVSVDLCKANIRIQAALAGDLVCEENASKGREVISSLTERKNALVGINADFFPFTGDPLGVCIVNGELVSEPYGNRAAVGITKNNCVIFDEPRHSASVTLPSGASRQIDGINRIRETNQVVLYTETFGATTQNKYGGTEVVLKSDDLPVRAGKDIKFTVVDVKQNATNTSIPKGGAVLSAGGPAAWFLSQNLKAGDNIVIRFDINSDCNCDWSQVEQAVGGGPWLVKGGKEYVDSSDEGFEGSFASRQHPRTAIGVTADNKLLLVTVDGRQSISEGLNLRGLAALMKKLGAINAINLDGGGSTTMSIKGLLVNSPSGGAQRAVADGVLVYAGQPEIAELSKLAITGVKSEVTEGENSQLYLTWGDDGQVLTPEQTQHVVWGVSGGVGFINQQGYFIPARAGIGAVNAFYGNQHVSFKVNVTSKKQEAPMNPDIIPTVPDTQNSNSTNK